MELHTHYETACMYRRTRPCLQDRSVFRSVVGVVSSDVTRSGCTTPFPPCCSIFCHFFFHGDVLAHLLMLLMHCIMGRPFFFSGTIPMMHFLIRLHPLFLHACPKKAIFPFIIWARSSRLFEVHPACSCLSFSPSNLSAAFFGSKINSKNATLLLCDEGRIGLTKTRQPPKTVPR